MKNYLIYTMIFVFYAVSPVMASTLSDAVLAPDKASADSSKQSNPQANTPPEIIAQPPLSQAVPSQLTPNVISRTGQQSGSVVSFSEDSAGYGRAFLELILPGVVESLRDGKENAAIKIAPIAVGSNPQAMFAVKLETQKFCSNPETCLVIVFAPSGTDWNPVLQVATRYFAFKPSSANSNQFPDLYTDGSHWSYKSDLYSLVSP